MKKFKLLAIAFIVGTATLFATEVDDPDVPKTEIRDQIIDLLENPEFTIENEVTVNVSFTFSSEGEIVVLNVDSQNDEVLSYIRTNLNHKTIENPGEQDKVFIMPLKFEKKWFWK